MCEGGKGNDKGHHAVCMYSEASVVQCINIITNQPQTLLLIYSVDYECNELNDHRLQLLKKF